MELLQVADAVAREKNIDRDEVLEAMEQAIQKAGRSKYGHEHDIRARIDRKTGDIHLMRYLEVVETVENEATQLTLREAQRMKKDAALGEFLTDELPPIDFGRIAAQTAKQVIVQKVREAERQRQFKEYKDRIGEVVNGLVKRVEYGNVTVDLGRAEAILRRDELLPREHFKNGDRVRAYIYDVRAEARGPQIFLSRTHPTFMAKLFSQEVPEIYDGIIEIKSVARDPGSRAKIAVLSHDSSIDPVGACVGMRGSRVQAVVGELQGEKIDIMTENEESERRSEEFKTNSQLFIDALDVDDVIAHLLVAEGFSSVEEIAFAEIHELAEIEGFDEDVAEELRDRARLFLDQQNSELTERRQALGVSEEIAGIEGFSPVMLVKLGENGVKTLDDLADLAGDELREILGKDAMSLDEANEIIMAARAHWFTEEGATAGADTGQDK